MATEAPEKDVGAAPAEGKITPEAIKAAENMIGMQLRPEGPYLQDATADTMRNWCNGIGDLNPDPDFCHFPCQFRAGRREVAVDP